MLQTMSLEYGCSNTYLNRPVCGSNRSCTKQTHKTRTTSGTYVILSIVRSRRSYYKDSFHSLTIIHSENEICLGEMHQNLMDDHRLVCEHQQYLIIRQHSSQRETQSAWVQFPWVTNRPRIVDHRQETAATWNPQTPLQAFQNDSFSAFINARRSDMFFFSEA